MFEDKKLTKKEISQLCFYTLLRYKNDFASISRYLRPTILNLTILEFNELVITYYLEYATSNEKQRYKKTFMRNEFSLTQEEKQMFKNFKPTFEKLEQMDNINDIVEFMLHLSEEEFLLLTEFLGSYADMHNKKKYDTYIKATSNAAVLRNKAELNELYKLEETESNEECEPILLK